MGNVGVDLTQFLPPTPNVGATDRETIANLVDFCNKLIGGFYEYAQMMQTRATISNGFTSMTDGTNTQYASEDAVLHLAGGDAMTVEFVTGTLTFVVDPTEISTSDLNNDAGWTANTTYSMDGDDFNALISGENTGIVDGDTCYITADSTTGTTRYRGETYRFASGSWTKIGHYAYATTISAGKISLTHDEVDGGDWTGTVDGTTAEVVSDGSTAANNALDGTYHLKKIVHGPKMTETWSNANASGLYLATDYMGFFNTSTNEWDVVINKDGTFYFGGNDDNYIEWDGANFNVYCQGGYLGSTTNYFDITNGGMLTTISNVRASYSGGSANFGTVSPNAVLLTTSYAGISGQPTTTGTTTQTWELKATDGDNVFYAYTTYNGGTPYSNVTIGNASGSHYIKYREQSTAEYEIYGFNFNACTVGSTGLTVAGSVRMNAGNLEYYSGGWRVLSYT